MSTLGLSSNNIETYNANVRCVRERISNKQLTSVDKYQSKDLEFIFFKDLNNFNEAAHPGLKENEQSLIIAINNEQDKEVLTRLFEILKSNW
jgi:hypothetical protein